MLDDEDLVEIVERERHAAAVGDAAAGKMPCARRARAPMFRYRSPPVPAAPAHAAVAAFVGSAAGVAREVDLRGSVTVPILKLTVFATVTKRILIRTVTRAIRSRCPSPRAPTLAAEADAGELDAEQARADLGGEADAERVLA